LAVGSGICTILQRNAAKQPPRAAAVRVDLRAECIDIREGSLVTQALQGQPFTPTSEVLRPRAGDRYLLCSDGLSDYVDDEAIGRCLSSSTDPQHSAEALVKLAIDAGAPDNVTVVVADVATG